MQLKAIKNIVSFRTKTIIINSVIAPIRRSVLDNIVDLKFFTHSCTYIFVYRLCSKRNFSTGCESCSFLKAPLGKRSGEKNEVKADT